MAHVFHDFLNMFREVELRDQPHVLMFVPRPNMAKTLEGCVLRLACAIAAAVFCAGVVGVLVLFGAALEAAFVFLPFLPCMSSAAFCAPAKSSWRKAW